MTHPIERLARFLAVSRRHLLDGVMPSRRVPRRAGRDDDAADDAWGALPSVATTRDARARGVVAFRLPAQPSNENRPSATSFASG